jgi:hypothetical protein
MLLVVMLNVIALRRNFKKSVKVTYVNDGEHVLESTIKNLFFFVADAAQN